MNLALDIELESRLQGMSDDQFRSLMYHMQAELARRFPDAAAIMDRMDATSDAALAALRDEAELAIGATVVQ